MADNVGITPGSGAKAGAHGSVVSSASVWCEHADRLLAEAEAGLAGLVRAAKAHMPASGMSPRIVGTVV